MMSFENVKQRRGKRNFDTQKNGEIVSPKREFAVICEGSAITVD